MKETLMLIGLIAMGFCAMWIGYKVIDAVFFFKEFRRTTTDTLDRIEGMLKHPKP